MRILPYLFICLLALHGAVSSDSESQEDDDDYEEQDRPDQLVCGTSWNCTCTKEEDPTVICDHARLKDSDTRLGTTYIGFPKDYKPKIVHMKDCDIKKLEKDRIVPSVAKQLVELDLSSNSIDYIGKDAFKGMDHLAILRLSHNNIKKLHRNTFHDDLGFKLHRLFLDYNDIENLPENAFEGLKELKMLVLDGNVFTQKLNKKMFAGLSNLETLSLDYCGLDHDSLPFDAFDELINLKALSLRGNKFEKVPAAVNSINHLEILDMSKTKVAEFGERSLKSDHKIKKLIMTDLPYMYFISNCAFCDLKNLEEIDFSNSRQLYNVHENAFGMFESEDERASSVKKINFANCSINALPVDLYDFESLEEFRLENNPLVCDCRTDFLASSNINYKDTPRCASPRRLAGVKLQNARHMCGFNLPAIVEAFFLLYCICLLIIGGSLFWVKGRCTNIFYKPDMPYMGYNNLRTRADADEEHKQLQNDFDPVNV